MAATDRRTELWQDLDVPDAGFRWHLPERFNLALACVDDQPPGDLALIVDDGDGEVQHHRFGELAERSARLATVLSALGVQRGDRVGIMAPQGMDVVTAHFACYRAGLVAVPLSVQFGPDALVYRLTDSAARALVVYAEGFGRLQGSWDQLADLEHVLLIGAPGTSGGGGPLVTDFAGAIDAAAPAAGAVDTAADDPALLMYTSGTTGPAKGVLHRQQIALAQMPGLRLSHDLFPQPGDVFWTPADWAWGGGLFDALLVSLLCGRPIVASDASSTPAGPTS